MKFGTIVQKKMYLLVILLLMIFVYFGGIQNIEINKTVGWHWDISNWLIFINLGNWSLYVIGYGILAILKFNTNKNLSILHLVLISILIVIKNFIAIHTFSMLIILLLLGLFVFFTNYIWAIKNRNADKK